MTVENPNPRLRLFVAIPIPEAVRNEIAPVQDELKRLAPAHTVRWVKPEQFHLTLKFLGDVSVEEVKALQQAVGSVCAARPALALRAYGLGFFPNARLPRVIWAGIGDDAGKLAELHAQVDAATRMFGVTSETASFSGHATLGRFKKFPRREMENFLRRVEALRERDFGSWTAGAVELVRSELAPDGARHTVLASFALGAG
ncbi:MAG TPA: RNA 2',3'-cyclic phosphodiesterase [Verrucomicrobiae bacterium]|nr:RNA 2',3'-cyclic phosphodiesterase [Verrucomicrobiae bacterium]